MHFNRQQQTEENEPVQILAVHPNLDAQYFLCSPVSFPVAAF
jgi:hypothetical protein